MFSEINDSVINVNECLSKTFNIMCINKIFYTA